VGLSLAGARSPQDWEQVLAQVERADALGLHSVWLPEGHFSVGAMPSPLVALAAFAARSRRLVLGTTSLLLPVRPPQQVADEVATLDRLSGGRVWLGLGRGFRAPLFAAFGVLATEKRDRFDRALDAILERWQGDGATPLQRPHPPLLVAAFGRKGLLQAASRGLPYLASPLESLATLEENYAFHRDHLPEPAEAGALPVAVIRTVHVAADDAERLRVLEALHAESARLRSALGRGSATGRPAGALARAAAGDPEERVLVGTADQVLERLADYRARIGLDLLIARGGVPGASAQEAARALERLQDEVVPRLARMAA
jgi:alkanesulfonate monooxygenase SsuD/methylene tetrahydromethanopterin reductase-like flavin-dependent oxidoreductase (luciferase family)